MLLAAKAGNSEINIWALICHDSQLTLRSAVGVYAAARAIAEKDRKIFDQVFRSVSERASNFHIECVPKNYTELKSKSNYSVLLFLWITLDDCIIDIIKWECSMRRNKGKSFSFSFASYLLCLTRRNRERCSLVWTWALRGKRWQLRQKDRERVRKSSIFYLRHVSLWKANHAWKLNIKWMWQRGIMKKHFNMGRARESSREKWQGSLSTSMMMTGSKLLLLCRMKLWD